MNQAVSVATTFRSASVDTGKRSVRASDLSAYGEPHLWMLGGALALGVVMVVGFLFLVAWNGFGTFLPRPIEVVTLADGTRVAGEPSRTEVFRVPADRLTTLPPDAQERIRANNGAARRTIYRTGNYDITNEDFRWVADFETRERHFPKDMVFIERLEWGPFVGHVKGLVVDGRPLETADLRDARVGKALAEAQKRLRRIHTIEREEIGAVNHALERDRLALRGELLASGDQSEDYRRLKARGDANAVALQARFKVLTEEAQGLKQRDARDTITFADIGGAEKTLPLSAVVRAYYANDLSWGAAAGVYLSRWWEFLSESPREANTEGGVLPAIFGTFAMTILMVIMVAPIGIVTALYLREYAKQGRLMALVRISVNNLAGVPSIVYGVFGLGFFAYLLGGNIDRLFYPERLPNPTFGTGGLLWASLTLAILTVPVVIVATEEALAAVPRSMREGSLACGASKWQTIRRIVLPRAMPGILTGIILAMARGAGEVAPLMLVGVVKLAPEMPIDGLFPFIHLERSFMHLGFHIYDVGFQSRNSEAGKPMVFVTTLLLIALVAAMNIAAIVIRNRLKRKFAGGHF
jgi:phosphate transport system permease protein